VATYLDALHGVSLSEALAEAAAVAPIGRVMLHTFELRHPALPAPIRIVNDHADLLATLEADAPLDAGTEVEFLACPVQITRPEESASAQAPSITLSVDNVSGAVSDALKLARGSLALWEVTERVYASDDTSAPAILPPLTLTMVSAGISATSVTITAAFGDPVNVSVPAIAFNRVEYPGLDAG
jgi:Domain of unknown function (DUF1833)